MTKSIMTCELFADRLADFLERDTDEATRAGMEAHALSCADCGPLLADLRRLRIDAANLPEMVPSRDLWAGIAARIETPVVELKSGAAVERRTSGTRTKIWIGLAAAGLVAITATVTHELTKRTVVQTVPSQVATKPDTVVVPKDTVLPVAPPVRAALVANRPSAEQTYQSEISSLRMVLNRRRPQLDSATVVVIEHNLKVIDDAIAQCRMALKKDPASRFLMESLNDAMDNKVQLLRTAAVLPSKM